MSRIFRAPGRVNLIGEHTDYTDGLVLPAAIDREIRLVCEPGGPAVSLVSEHFGGSVEIPARGGAPVPGEGWGRYAAAVVDELAALGRPQVGLRGRLESGLPAGVGLSSSAALEVVLATALCAVAEFELDPPELAQACRRAEHRAVGVPSGIMDQATSILGVAGHCLLLDCGTLEHRAIPLPPELAVVVLDSGVVRSLEASDYASRRQEVVDALAVLDGRRPADVSPAEAAERAASAKLEPVLRRRLRHVVTENERVRQVAEALSAPGGADRDRLRSLLAAGHASLRDDLEVSISELDLLVELALEAGAVAARLTGGGFGGAIVALVDHDRAEELGESVAGRYLNRTGRTATVHRCVTVDGAGEVPPTS